MWTEGYVTSVPYTAEYYPELSPNHIRLALMNAGLVGLPDAPVRYLELGYGQGLSLAIHASANEGEFWGTDFNSAHAEFARRLISAAGCAATILDESFSELALRPDLPRF